MKPGLDLPRVLAMLAGVPLAWWAGETASPVGSPLFHLLLPPATLLLPLTVLALIRGAPLLRRRVDAWALAPALIGIEAGELRRLLHLPMAATFSIAAVVMALALTPLVVADLRGRRAGQ